MDRKANLNIYIWMDIVAKGKLISRRKINVLLNIYSTDIG